MIVNGEKVEVLSYRIWPNERRARLALDNNGGTLVLRFNEGYAQDNDCLDTDPEELKFYCTDTRGNVETWHAIYKERWRVNPKTDKRESFRPSLLCHVTKADYDVDERREFDRCEKKRESWRRLQAEEAQRAQNAREREELDQACKLAIVKLAEGMSKPTESVLPGWKRNKLVLRGTPNGAREPAVFKFGTKAYTVPAGKAWDTVLRLIGAGAFDAHGLKMKSPSQNFKGKHRAFFSERITKNESGWYIKTQ
jgi:hypothetical protein